MSKQVGEQGLMIAVETLDDKPSFVFHSSINLINLLQVLSYGTDSIREVLKIGGSRPDPQSELALEEQKIELTVDLARAHGARNLRLVRWNMLSSSSCWPCIRKRHLCKYCIVRW